MSYQYKQLDKDQWRCLRQEAKDVLRNVNSTISAVELIREAAAGRALDEAWLLRLLDEMFVDLSGAAQAALLLEARTRP